MGTFDFVSRFFLRFRYPVTLPEDVADALGVELSNYLSFEDFVECITSPKCCPTRLSKFMPRKQAEDAFERAQCKEQFRDRTLISYQFNEGWMEFDLRFDNDSRLRRLYIQHRHIQNDSGVEIRLKTEEKIWSNSSNRVLTGSRAIGVRE